MFRTHFSSLAIASLFPFFTLACATAVNVDDGNLGGDTGSGGAGTGGSSSGGATGTGGGLVGTGGSATGGAATGGAATGGAATGGAATGGAATGGAATGGAATGGAGTGGSTGECAAVTCGTGPYPKPSSALCVTITVTQYGGWQVSNATGCTFTLNGASAQAGAQLATGANEIEFAGCTSPDVSWSCWQ